jgi:hypothetical protein
MSKTLVLAHYKDMNTREKREKHSLIHNATIYTSCTRMYKHVFA